LDLTNSNSSPTIHFVGETGITVNSTAVANTVKIIAADASNTNEVQSLTLSNGTNPTATLSPAQGTGGGTINFEGTNGVTVTGSGTNKVTINGASVTETNIGTVYQGSAYLMNNTYGTSTFSTTRFYVPAGSYSLQFTSNSANCLMGSPSNPIPASNTISLADWNSFVGGFVELKCVATTGLGTPTYPICSLAFIKK